MDFRVLGPLEVVGDSVRGVSIGKGRQRALLALLILRANELVATDRLVEALWGVLRVLGAKYVGTSCLQHICNQARYRNCVVEQIAVGLKA